MDEKSLLRLRVVVVSPSDVPEERSIVTAVVNSLNRVMGVTQNLQLDLWKWETDAHLDFHPEGPQGVIDSDMRIEQADIVVGIFWARFGTPTSKANSGTAHELNNALSAKLASKRNLPEINLYFKTTDLPQNVDFDQFSRLREFKADIFRKCQCFEYPNTTEFQKRVEHDLLSFINRRLPSLPMTVSNQAESVATTTNLRNKRPPLQMEPIETEIFQDFQVDRIRLDNPNPVEYLWVDVCSPDNSVIAAIGAEENRPHLLVKFKNSPRSWPGNVAIRPRGGRAVSTNGKRTLTFEARALGNMRNRESGTEVCCGARLVNGWCQHWAYGGERRYLPLPIGSTWKVLELPLDSSLWWHFPSELFRHEAPNYRDFSALTLLVLEFGSAEIDRPGSGEGVVLIRDIRLRS
jgi:hypothetical protein